MKFAIFVCIIGVILGNQKNNPAAHEPEPTEQLEKDAIDSMEKSLSSYHATFKQLKPWTNFHQQLQSHTRVKHAYTSNSGALAGQIMELLLNVDRQYFEATQPLYNFCGESSPLFDGYKSLFGHTDKDSIDGQKELLLKIIDTDVEKSNMALDRLKQTFSTLNTATDKLDTLILQLHDDFAEGSQLYKDEIRRRESGAERNLSKVQIIKEVVRKSIDGLKKFVPQVGLIEPFLKQIDNDTDKQADTATKLKAEFADIFKFCKDLWTKLNEQTKIDFVSIENDLNTKIQTVEKLKEQIKSNGIPLQRDTTTIASAIGSLNKCCKSYRSAFGKVNK